MFFPVSGRGEVVLNLNFSVLTIKKKRAFRKLTLLSQIIIWPEQGCNLEIKFKNEKKVD